MQSLRWDWDPHKGRWGLFLICPSSIDTHKGTHFRFFWPSPGNTGFCSTIPMPMQFCQILYNYNTIQYNAICLNIAYNTPQYRLNKYAMLYKWWKGIRMSDCWGRKREWRTMGYNGQENNRRMSDWKRIVVNREKQNEREKEIERGEKRVSPYLTIISGSQQEVRVSRDLMDNKENNERKPLVMTEKKRKGKD